MVKIGFLVAKVRSKIEKNPERLSDYYRKGGAKIGKNCVICSNLDTCDKYMLTIGDDVTVSTNVTFVTHDHSIYHVRKKYGDLWGKIKIGNNCFIGENATVLYGVTLADNIIVAAGSVVTKSFSESNVIIGGNPARVISTWEKFGAKYAGNHWNGHHEMMSLLDTDDDRFVRR